MIRRAPREEATGWVADGRLSFTAKGVLGFILAQPDNYRVSRDALADHGPDGQYVIRRALKELTDAGYIARERIREANGTFTTDTVVYESPTAKRGFQPPLVDYPPPANQPVKASIDLSIDNQTPAARGKSRWSQEAHDLTSAWWDKQNPKPAQPFPAIAKVVERILSSGWPPESVAQFLVEAPVVSAKSFDFWRNRDRTKRKTASERTHDNMRKYLENSDGEERSNGHPGPHAGQLGSRGSKRIDDRGLV